MSQVSQQQYLQVVDEALRVINTHPEHAGMDFRYAEREEAIDGSRPCPAWIECVIHRRDRTQPVVAREYLDESYRGARPGDLPYWQEYTKRALRNVAIVQAARMAYGFCPDYEALANGDRPMPFVSMPVALPSAAADSSTPAAARARQVAVKDDTKKPKRLTKAKLQMIRAKLQRSGKSYEELEKRFACPASELTESAINEVVAWIDGRLA